MPGPYSKPLRPQPDASPGLGAHIFQPPRTPASTSYASGVRGRGDWDGSQPYPSRKRSRPDPPSDGDSYNAPYPATANRWPNIAGAASILRSDAGSPGPFVNTSYTCAGGLDTPGLAAAAVYDNDNDNFHQQDPYMHFRRRWSVTSGGPEEEYGCSTPAPPVLGAGGKRRLPASANNAGSIGWGDCLFTFVANAAGRVLQFARSTSFNGFYAGGGTGYGLDNPMQGHQPVGPTTILGHTNSRSSFDISSTPIPGQYPVEDDYGTAAAGTPLRPVKRQQTDAGSGWVLVPHADEGYLGSSPGLSTRRTSRASGAPRLSVSRPAGGPRRSFLPASRRSSFVSHIGSPALHPDRAASHVSPGSRPPSRKASVENGGPMPNRYVTPVSPELQQYATQRRKEEKEADTNMRKFNARLKAMIKEGREALGTKIEIEDDDEMEDEGFAEGFLEVREKW